MIRRASAPLAGPGIVRFREWRNRRIPERQFVGRFFGSIAVVFSSTSRSSSVVLQFFSIIAAVQFSDVDTRRSLRPILQRNHESSLRHLSAEFSDTSGTTIWVRVERFDPPIAARRLRVTIEDSAARPLPIAITVY